MVTLTGIGSLYNEMLVDFLAERDSMEEGKRKVISETNEHDIIWDCSKK